MIAKAFSFFDYSSIQHFYLFKKIIYKELKINFTDEEIETLLSALDDDKDGEINYR
jgi:Ca2+-binding EF-hand superfamily protein